MAASAARAQDTGLFYALFFDGSHVSAPPGRKDVWWSGEANVGGRPLFLGKGYPVRLIEDRALVPAPKSPRVVMANGDILPGRVMGFLPESAEHDLPARLLVSVDYPLVAADPHGLAVRIDRIQRITTAPDDEHAAEPGTLVLANGARLAVRAMRWSSDGLRALTERGVTKVRFDAIADFCIPHADVMGAVLDDSFYPPLGPAAVVTRLETVQGAVLTFHRGITLGGSGKAPDSPGWVNPTEAYMLTQPNWSTALLLVAADSIRRESFRAADEVPLSSLPAATAGEQIGVHHWPWRRNANVAGQGLAAGEIAVDLGVGTHAGCEIAFDLPPGAKAFTSLVGIDRRMPPAACAVAKVYAETVSGNPLFSSGFLRGGRQPTPVGPLGLADCSKLVLVSQWAGEDAPADAYPLDIGGHVDWLMPFVIVDASEDDYCRALRRFVPGWSKWDLETADATRIRVTPTWDFARERWLPVLFVDGKQPLTLRRKLVIASANDCLNLVVGHVPDGPLPGIELRVDGVLIVPRNLPASAAAFLKDPKRQVTQAGKPVDVQPSCLLRTLRWDLRRFDGHTIQLTLSLSFDQRQKGLAWYELAERGAGSREQGARSGETR